MATGTDELVASIMAAIEAAPPSGGLSLTYGQVELGVRAALEASAPSTVTGEELVGRLRYLVGLVEEWGDQISDTDNISDYGDLTFGDFRALYALASGHTALLRENKVLREALLTAQLLTVAHRKRVEDKLDAILQALARTGSENPHG
jgi:hypothetical protein